MLCVKQKSIQYIVCDCYAKKPEEVTEVPETEEVTVARTFNSGDEG